MTNTICTVRNLSRMASVSSKRIAILGTTAIRSSSSIPMICHERINKVSNQNLQSIRKLSSPVANGNTNNQDLATILLLLSPPSSQNRDMLSNCDSIENDTEPSPARCVADENGNEDEVSPQQDDNYKLKLQKKAEISQFLS